MTPRKALRYTLGMVVGLFILVACSGDLSTEGPAPAATSTSVPVVLSSLDRIASPDVPSADLRELAAGNNAFAFDLYHALGSEEDNLLYSPYSISQALAMTYAGARGETEQQMADTLHFTLPQERLHPAFNALDRKLASRSHVSIGAPAVNQTEEVAFELHIANAIWGQQGYPFLPEYLDVLAQHYGAGIYTIDLAQADAVDVVNDWVNEETGGRIPRILDSISKDARLILANAIYFNARWDLPFDEEETDEDTFYLLDGEQVEVPMMHQTESFRYTEGDGYQAIQLPYLSRRVAMVILLPQSDRFQEIEDQLNSEWVDSILTELVLREVVLTLPRFSFETPIMPLEKILPGMGMPDAFSDYDADFSGQTGTRDLKIGRVLHKAFIEVNELRTEAAAVTVVEEKTVTEMIEVEATTPVVIKIDRPFIFIIRDIETHTMLFLGRVVDPVR